MSTVAPAIRTQRHCARLTSLVGLGLSSVANGTCGPVELWWPFPGLKWRGAIMGHTGSPQSFLVAQPIRMWSVTTSATTLNPFGHCQPYLRPRLPQGVAHVRQPLLTFAIRWGWEWLATEMAQCEASLLGCCYQHLSNNRALSASWDWEWPEVRKCSNA